MSITSKKFLLNVMVFFMVVLIIPVKKSYATDSVVIIANSFSNSKRLTPAEIDDIFTLRSKKWNNGIPIKLFLLPKDTQRTQEFTLKYLHMTPNRYFDILDSRTAHNRNFEILDYEYSVMIKVLTTPGGIGYVSDSFLTNFNGDVNIIR